MSCAKFSSSSTSGSKLIPFINCAIGCAFKIGEGNNIWKRKQHLESLKGCDHKYLWLHVKSKGSAGSPKAISKEAMNQDFTYQGESAICLFKCGDRGHSSLGTSPAQTSGKGGGGRAQYYHIRSYFLLIYQLELWLMNQ